MHSTPSRHTTLERRCYDDDDDDDDVVSTSIQRLSNIMCRLGRFTLEAGYRFRISNFLRRILRYRVIYRLLVSFLFFWVTYSTNRQKRSEQRCYNVVLTSI